MSPLKTAQPLPHSIIIGAEGYVGSRLLAAHRTVRPATIGTSRRNPPPDGLLAFDLSQAAADASSVCASLGITTERDALFCAAIAVISVCEADPPGARRVNVDGTLHTAKALYQQGVRPVFFSSDYVFDGVSGGYADLAATAPATEYGRQKAEVEQRLLEMTHGDALVLRLGKVFSLERGDGTLLDEMASLLLSGRPVRAATDQVFCTILLDDAVRAVLEAQCRGLCGIMNVCSSEAMSRYEMAVRLARALGVDEALVQPILLDEIAMGNRPKNTSMLPQRLEEELGMYPAPISQCIEQAGRRWRPALL